MELKLTDGRYSASGSGGMELVSGYEELMQRVTMKLSARRGGFAAMPDYGSRLHLLYRTKPSDRQEAAKKYVAEALAEESDVTVEDLEVLELGNGALGLRLELMAGGGSAAVVTTI